MAPRRRRARRRRGSGPRGAPGRAGGPGHPGRGKADRLPLPPAGARRASRRQASATALRRDRGRAHPGRTTGRAELAARHPSFGLLSPEVGRLDEDTFGQLLAADPEAAVALLADLTRATDARLREAARRLAARVFVRLGRAGRPQARAARRLGASRAEGDLDLDATLDRWSGPGPPQAEDLVTRAWQAHNQATCLLIDASGSMSGPGVAIAAVAAASVVLAADRRLDPAVLAFSGGVTVLQALGARREPGGLVGDLVALRGHGLTDLAGALRAAAAQLAGAASGERVVLLLSDCLPTAGRDPAQALAGISRLDVLCPLPTVTQRPPRRRWPAGAAG
jgi:magnesium chelatase subunit D